MIPATELMDNLTLYTKMHIYSPDFQHNNQGLDCFDLWKDKLFSIQKPVRETTAIEIGCGNGLLCKKLSNIYFLGFKMTGIDLVDGPYDRSGYVFKQLDIMNLLSVYDVNSFDYALCFDVLEHLDENEVVFALKQISQIAPVIIMSMACYGSAPLHLTVKSPGWWLDKVMEVCPHINWSVLKVFERHTYCPVTLMYGTVK